jgi:hypothetical protein
MLDIPDKNVETRSKSAGYQPKLDTIRMVEEFIKEHSGDYKKRALWEHLPKKMMYQTFSNAFDYLLESGKIARDRKGYVIWIWNPAIVKKYLLRDDLTIR